MELPQHPAFAAWATTTTLLFVKLFANSAVGLAWLKHRPFVRPEDARFYGRNTTPVE